MRGLIKATHACATRQAWADWQQLAACARASGYETADLEPPAGAGHKTVDRRINALMRRMGITIPFWRWQEEQGVQK